MKKNITNGFSERKRRQDKKRRCKESSTSKAEKWNNIVFKLPMRIYTQKRNTDKEQYGNPCRYLILGTLVGAGTQQQKHTVRVTLVPSPHQRRVAILRLLPILINTKINKICIK